jgi:hypothetical protein
MRPSDDADMTSHNSETEFTERAKTLLRWVDTDANVFTKIVEQLWDNSTPHKDEWVSLADLVLENYNQDIFNAVADRGFLLQDREYVQVVEGLRARFEGCDPKTIEFGNEKKELDNDEPYEWPIMCDGCGKTIGWSLVSEEDAMEHNDFCPKCQ